MRSVVAAHQCDQPTLYGNTIRSKNSCFVGRVSGFKRDRRAFTAQALQCGFLTINERNSVAMVANHTIEAKDLGADAMVTPCPLCHLNLDGYQPKAAAQRRVEIDLPILHLPQVVGLAMGLDPKGMGLNRHIISAKKFLSKVAVSA